MNQEMTSSRRKSMNSALSAVETAELLITHSKPVTRGVPSAMLTLYQLSYQRVHG